MGQPATPQIHECSHAASRTVPWPPAGATSPGWGRNRHSTGERCFCMVCTPAHRKTWCLPVKQTRRISPIWIALTNSGIRIITTMLPIAPSSRRHALHTGTLPFIPPPPKTSRRILQRPSMHCAAPHADLQVSSISTTGCTVELRFPNIGGWVCQPERKNGINMHCFSIRRAQQRPMSSAKAPHCLVRPRLIEAPSHHESCGKRGWLSTHGNRRVTSSGAVCHRMAFTPTHQAARKSQHPTKASLSTEPV